jgi:hypothetical protein
MNNEDEDKDFTMYFVLPVVVGLVIFTILKILALV